MKDRSAVQRKRQQRRGIRRCRRQLQVVGLFNVLTSPEFLDRTEACLPLHRERLYPPTVTLSMFLSQALEEDRSCQRAANAWAVQRLVEGLSAQSTRTGAYCKARQRLPLSMVQSLARETGRMLSAAARDSWRWRGRVVKLVDGTGISMPDTMDNQAIYPQPSGQADGVGFPLARVVSRIAVMEPVKIGVMAPLGSG